MRKCPLAGFRKKAIDFPNETNIVPRRLPWDREGIPQVIYAANMDYPPT